MPDIRVTEDEISTPEQLALLRQAQALQGLRGPIGQPTRGPGEQKLFEQDLAQRQEQALARQAPQIGAATPAPQIGQPAPQQSQRQPPPQMRQPVPPPMPQQGRQNYGQAAFEGFGAGVQGMSVPQMRFMQGQAQLQQFEIQQKMRVQRAEQNIQNFKQKMPAVGKHAKDILRQRQEEAKRLDQPIPQMTIDILDEASQRYDALANQGMQVNEVDQDTMTLTGAGRQYMAELGILPYEELTKVNSQAQQAINAQYQAITKQMQESLQVGNLFDRINPQGPQANGQPLSPELIANERLGALAQQRGVSPERLSAQLTNAPIRNEIDPQTGQVQGQSIGRIPADLATTGFRRSKAPMLDQLTKQEAQFSLGMVENAVKGKNAEPPMSGAEANALMRQRMSPLLNDPTSLNFYGEGQKVSLDQLNKDADELGENLRSSKTAESRDALQAERLRHKSSEADKTREAASSLATMKAENMSERLEKSHDLKMRLFTMGENFKDARQRNTFSQQQQRDQFKAEASLNKQRELLQTQAGIAFTKEAIQNDADTAIKFALEAERAGNVTARGLIGDVLETNPSLAWPILERLGTLSKENGLSSNSVTAVKGAIEDYMKRRSSFTSEEMAQDIINGPGTDKDKNTKLAMELRKAKSNGNEKAADYYQFLLDSRKSSGQTINIDNRPPPEGGIGMDKTLTRKQTEQLLGAQNAIGVINDLRGYMEDTPISGLAGLQTAINNVVAGTMYDFSRIQDGVSDEAYRALFQPSFEPGRLLTNQLKYMVARAREGSGQLAKSDIEAVNIGTSYIKDDSLSLESAINGLEQEMFRVMSETSERLSSGGVKLTPTASDRDLVIQSFVDDPDFAKYPKDKVNVLIQDMFLKGSNVMIGKTELNDIIRDIKSRRK